MKNFLVLGVVVLVLVGGTSLVVRNGQTSIEKTPSPALLQPTATPTMEVVNYQAAFLIYTNGLLRDFGAQRYHNRSSDVYIRKENPNLIHVNKSGITWDDFFKTLPMKVTRDCLTTGTNQTFCSNEQGSLNFYLNNQREENFLQQEIKPGDKALISFGKEDNEAIQRQLETLDRIFPDEN